MSRKSRTLKKARAGDDEQLSVSKLRGPADVAVMVPYLLGFQPVESLVLVALHGPRKRFGPVLRIDLVEDESLLAEQSDLVVGVMRTNRIRRVIVVAFSERATQADPLVAQVLDSLAEHRIAVEDAFRAGGDRWWSYVCHNPRCCSPDGVAYDAGTSRVAVEAVVAGLSFEPDRESLRSQLAPDDPETRRCVASAVSELASDWPALQATPSRVEDAVSRAMAAPEDLSASEIAWLALAVQTPAGLESAVTLVTRSSAEQHYQLWRAVTRRVADDLVPAVGCLAGFAAWLSGRGVLASHAVDRVLEVAPGHPFAQMVADLLARAVNPGSWEGPPRLDG